MSLELRRAIADFFRRSWWVWTLVAMLQGLNAVLLLSGRSPFPLNWMIAFGLSLQGYTQSGVWQRAMHTLPLSRRDIGQLLWWSRIGVPGAVLSVASLAPFLAVPFMKTSPLIWPVFIALARAWGALGLAMLVGKAFRRVSSRPLGATTGVPALPRLKPSMPKRVLLISFGISLFIAWPVAIIALLVTAIILPFPSMPLPITLLTGVGVASAAYFFARADRYVLSRPADLRGLAAAPTKETSKLSAGGMSGWLVMVRQQVTFASIMIVTIIVLQYVAHRGPTPQSDVYTITLMVTGVFQPTIWIPAMRVFRSLPVPTGRLAFALMLTMLAPMTAPGMVLYGVGIYLHWSKPPLMLIFLLPFAAVGLPFALRFSSRRFATVLAMIPILLGIYLADTFGKIQSSIFIGLELGAGALILAACYAWTRYELTNGLHAYRARSTQLISFGGGLLPR